jgi:hypothetical protein
LKQLVTILLFSLFLVQNFTSYWLIADYWLNKSFVARNLCENRNKPRMHCNGKCYLHKQLAKENKQNDASAPDAKIKIEPAVFLFQQTIGQFVAVVKDNPPQYGRYIFSLLPGIAKSVFHPPLA